MHIHQSVCRVVIIFRKSQQRENAAYCEISAEISCLLWNKLLESFWQKKNQSPEIREINKKNNNNGGKERQRDGQTESETGGRDGDLPAL